MQRKIGIFLYSCKAELWNEATSSLANQGSYVSLLFIHTWYLRSSCSALCTSQ